jgi:hypothetical protein
MYDIEEITDNYNDDSRWFSVIEGMDCYRVELHDSGYTAYYQDGTYIQDDELFDRITSVTMAYIDKEGEIE